MDEFKNDTFKLLEKIAALNDKVIEHTQHPQEVAREIAELIAIFGISH